MATVYHNLSDYDFNLVPNAEEMKFGIVVSECETLTLPVPCWTEQ